MVSITSDGWLRPEGPELTFSLEKSTYYVLSEKVFNLQESLGRLPKSWCPDPGSLESKLHELKSAIKSHEVLSGLLNGCKFPFVVPADELARPDLGDALENLLFPTIKERFETVSGKNRFRAMAQGDLKLREHLASHMTTGQVAVKQTLAAGESLCGWIFPTALLGYSVASQRMAIKRVLASCADAQFKVSLAGVLEIGAGLVLYPTMLNDPQSYTPVLCASGDTHIDERYALTFKSYGPHLEFWLLPNRIDPDTEQISEQWGGVISIWSKL